MTLSNVLAAPRNKLLAAAVCLCSLALWASLEHGSAMQAARGLLGASALVGLLVWARTTATRRATFARPLRLEVIQRVGLTQRTGVALIEVDGQPYLVVHGDGFARMRPTRAQREVA